MEVIGQIVRGDYEILPVTITEPDPSSPGNRRVRNITADTFRFTAKRDISETTGVITKTVGSGITKTDAVNGKLEIEILPADTTQFQSKTKLVCDLEGTATGGRPFTTLFQVEVLMDVST